jgi:head-tail adaptor
MAIKLNSGDLNQHIILKQPTHEQNEEGGREAVSLTNTITTWAAVRVVNESRLSGVDGTAY